MPKLNWPDTRAYLNDHPDNLEDISQPKCFRILDTLRERADIPIWRDDQQGTATATLAGLMNARKVVGKRIEDVRIALRLPESGR